MVCRIGERIENFQIDAEARAIGDKVAEKWIFSLSSKNLSLTHGERMNIAHTASIVEAFRRPLRILARAHDIQERLLQNSELTLHAIGSQERITPGYVFRLLRLPSLAPDIITAIINGKNPPELTAKKLMRLALEIPVDWTAQRKLLGFHG